MKRKRYRREIEQRKTFLNVSLIYSSITVVGDLSLNAQKIITKTINIFCGSFYMTNNIKMVLCTD